MIQIPFPERIPVDKAAIVGGLLSGVLLAEGNDPTLCITVFALLLTGVIGFNIAGGFRRPAGAYIFFTVLFTGLLGVMVKALTNEPVMDNVPNADEALVVYLVGTCGMVAAAWLANRFSPRKSLLSGRLTQANTSQVVTGCLAMGIGLQYIALPQFIGSITRQLNILLPLAVLVGVYQRTRATNGRSSFSWPVFIGWAYTTWFGLLSYSKEGIFTSSLAWAVAALAGRIRMSVLQLMIVIPAAGFALLVLVPYAQYGRNFRNETAADHTVAYKLLMHPLALRDKVNADIEMRPDLYHFYNKSRGIFDRLTMLPIDAALIRRTDITGPIGTTNTLFYFENIAPHFLSPNKPDLHVGNDYAHEIGMLAPEDHSTGISFSPYADAYHQAGYWGVALLMPGVLTLLFLVTNSVVGSTEEGPWALFFISAFGHIAPEGMLLMPVYVLSYGMEAIIATSFAMIYITPLLGTLLFPSRRSVVHRVEPRSHTRTAGRATAPEAI